MSTAKTPFCKVPFLVGFTTSDQERYRDCCSKHPTIVSDQGQPFEQWWRSDKLNAFRQQLLDSDQWPSACWRCKVSEQQQGTSFRTAVNQWPQTDYDHPAGWNIMFGNICNLGCWSCSEKSSSVIFQHKKKAGLIQGNDLTEQKFQNNWPQLKSQVLQSYEHHDTVTLTLLGGEPLYNKTVIAFLSQLVDLGLASRTRLEFHTNATQFPHKIFPSAHNNTWQYVSAFVSLDAVGPYAEWLRYGCSWPKVDAVVNSLIKACDHTEIHCTLTVLNINQLTALQKYANSKQLKLNISPADDPEFMALRHWDQHSDQLMVDVSDTQWQTFHQLIGCDARPGMSEQLRAYIKSFDQVRKPLHIFDAELAGATGW